MCKAAFRPQGIELVSDEEPPLFFLNADSRFNLGILVVQENNVIRRTCIYEFGFRIHATYSFILTDVVAIELHS
jgi:hypothetical protein